MEGARTLTGRCSGQPPAKIAPRRVESSSHDSGGQPGRNLGAFALVAGEDVAVDLEGECDVGVAEAFADHRGVLAHGEEVR